MITEIIIVLLIVAVWLCHRGMISAFNWLMDKLAIIMIGGMFTYGLMRGFLS